MKFHAGDLKARGMTAQTRVDWPVTWHVHFTKVALSKMRMCKSVDAHQVCNTSPNGRVLRVAFTG